MCWVKWLNLGPCFPVCFSTIHDRSFSTVRAAFPTARCKFLLIHRIVTNRTHCPPQSPLIMGGSLLAFSLNDRLDEMGNYVGIHASAQQCRSLYKLDVNKLKSI